MWREIYNNNSLKTNLHYPCGKAMQVLRGKLIASRRKAQYHFSKKSDVNFASLPKVIIP